MIFKDSTKINKHSNINDSSSVNLPPTWSNVACYAAINL